MSSEQPNSPIRARGNRDPPDDWFFGQILSALAACGDLVGSRSEPALSRWAALDPLVAPSGPVWARALYVSSCPEAPNHTRHLNGFPKGYSRRYFRGRLNRLYSQEKKPRQHNSELWSMNRTKTRARGGLWRRLIQRPQVLLIKATLSVYRLLFFGC